MSGSITIVGLGSGDADQLTLGVWRTMCQAKHLYVRTEQHPAIAAMKQEGLQWTSFDALYQQADSFAEVYDQIVERLIGLALRDRLELVYAVPGHPMVAEAAVHSLLKKCAEQHIDCTVMGGESFLDQAFARLHIDPVEGLQFFDAATVQSSWIRPELHTVITQVYDQFSASEAKLCLMEVYPDETPVVLAQALGVKGEETIRQVPLYELDRIGQYGNMAMVYVPPSEDEQLRLRMFERLHEIVAILRSPQGCPWDREQTHDSIRKNLLEETYEVLEAIDDNDSEAMCEELGDLLLQVMLHAQMEEERGSFSVYEVVQTLNEKLIRRHPHVFGERKAGNAEQALANWQEIKNAEKKAKGLDPQELSVLDGIPRNMPAIMNAYELQKKAAKVGFDWKQEAAVMDKLAEEVTELKQAMSMQTKDEMREEWGDVVFSLINIARFLEIDPEQALALTNQKFKRRFQYIEQQLRLQGRRWEQAGLSEMEELWQQAKQLEKRKK